MPRLINDGTEEVAITRLNPHPRNVNQGDFGAIQESIENNGFFGRLVVSRRTCHILAGNHRYHVAKLLGYETLPVEWVDVDPETELRILLADNRTSRLGSDDSAQLAALLAELADSDSGLLGTGYDGDDLDQLIGDLANCPIGLDSTQYEGTSSSRDTGINQDGSRYTICPNCNHEFEVKPPRVTRSNGRRKTY